MPSWVDIIVKNGKIYLKDMGKDYRLLKEKGYIEKLNSYDRGYENTMLIGMNDSGISCVFLFICRSADKSIYEFKNF